MILFKKIPMICEGRNYEIRVLYDDSVINVVAFLNNHPANGFRHQVKISKQVDIKGVLETDAAKELVEICKNDIIGKRWEKWLAVIQENTMEH